jgi:hypothetical protein
LPACNVEAHTCVACTENAHCSGATPICDVSSYTCVQCLANAECPDEAPLCDVTANECVECLKPQDCGEATASRCEAGQCLPCAKDSDCAQILGRNLCVTGACVECTEANPSACAGNSCDPRRNQCTSTALGSVGLCRPCVSDRECSGGTQADPDTRCAPMQFQGTPRTEAFCLRRSVKGCARPFMQMPDAVVSRSGAAAERYCGVDQLSTRCEAVLDLIDSQTCADGQAASCACPRNAAGQCTAPGSGALCGTVGGVANSCTYACGTANDCPNGRICSVDIPYCH